MKTPPARRPLMIAAIASMLILAGCKADAPASAKGKANMDGVTFTEERGDPPAFERTYVAHMGAGFTVEVKLETFLGDRSDESVMTQPDGKEIMFDADAVADEIIDRRLYPLVQAAVDRILAIDAAWIVSKPAEYTDSTGTTWRRVP